MGNKTVALTSEDTILDISFLSGGGEIADLIKEKDWSKTTLGKISYWPNSLRTAISICLNSKVPILIIWGREFISFYNEPYSKLIGTRHPLALGAETRLAWPDMWDSLEPRLSAILNNGNTVFAENKLTLINRKGYLEESYFTTSQSPIYTETGLVGGIFATTFETTRQIIQSRQLETLDLLEKKMASARKLDELYKIIIEVIETNSSDFPYASIYKINEEEKMAKLFGKTGTIPGYNPSYEIIDLKNESPANSNFVKCIKTRQPVLVHDIRERLGDSPSGKWKAPPEEGLILPINNFSKVLPLAILATSVNPYLKLDEIYLSFFIRFIDIVERGINKLFVNEKEKSEAESNYKGYRQLNKLLAQAPVSFAILTGPKFIIDLVNESMLPLWGKTSVEEVLKKPFFEIVPIRYDQILQNVYQSGIRHEADESVTIQRNGKEESIYVNIIFEALRDENDEIMGVMALAIDITSQTTLRRNIEESQEQLRIAIEAAELGTYSWELPQTELVFSDRTAQIYGYKGRKDLTQTDLVKTIHPDDMPILAAAYEDCQKTNRLEYECRLIWPDGSLHWISVRSNVNFNDQKVPIKMQGTVMDITNQKVFAENLEREVVQRTKSLAQKNEELKRSEERYQRITEEVQDYAIILLSPSGDILNWNKGAEKIKGYRQDEILGKNIKIFYLPEDQNANLPERLIKEAAEAGRAFHEGPRIKKDGTVFWGSTVITALHGDKGQIIGFTKVTRDLSERKLIEDQMKQYTADLEFQNQELEQFAYIASHDLQEPLRIIRIYAQLVEKTLEYKEGTELYFKKIHSAVQRMQELIKSVLYYSRLTSIKSEFEKTDLNIILENVKSDFEMLIKERSANIKTDKLPEIMAVPIQMDQLFSNLISNSLKFSNSTPVIEIKAKIINQNEVSMYPFLNQALEYVQLQFKDNGIGFEQEYAEKIFEVFQRLHEKQTYEGTGVGLALCKKIVMNHGGFITAESEPGKGSIFNVYLPAH